MCGCPGSTEVNLSSEDGYMLNEIWPVPAEPFSSALVRTTSLHPHTLEQESEWDRLQTISSI